ncbi:high-affinity choline transporter 1-like [Physella acuta]|uniref:high-affinity choline transporter 1-like n=1 Tax=Physella acuta TaxID=109671 RepID=UPI0027DBDB5F|nr:high-affinity choline transporter 1-like [Physella acuta]
MSINIPCLVAVIILYILILIIGIIAARKTNKAKDTEEVMIANRSMGLWLSFFTMTVLRVSQLVHALGVSMVTCLSNVFFPQAFYQRILASQNVRVAMYSTIGAAVMSSVMAVPPALMGYAGAAADWNQTSYDGPIPIPDDRKSYILPMTLNYLVPLPVSIIGMSAICAAVMSSADSSFLSAATVFTRNIYKEIIRTKATDRELLWVLRVCVVIFGVLGTLIAIFATTIYGLFVLCRWEIIHFIFR